MVALDVHQHRIEVVCFPCDALRSRIRVLDHVSPSPTPARLPRTVSVRADARQLDTEAAIGDRRYASLRPRARLPAPGRAGHGRRVDATAVLCRSLRRDR
jgi:hypothetical protein